MDDPKKPLHRLRGKVSPGHHVDLRPCLRPGEVAGSSGVAQGEIVSEPAVHGELDEVAPEDAEIFVDPDPYADGRFVDPEDVEIKGAEDRFRSGLHAFRPASTSVVAGGSPFRGSRIPTVVTFVNIFGKVIGGSWNASTNVRSGNIGV